MRAFLRKIYTWHRNNGWAPALCLMITFFLVGQVTQIFVGSPRRSSETLFPVYLALFSFFFVLIAVQAIGTALSGVYQFRQNRLLVGALNILLGIGIILLFGFVILVFVIHPPGVN